MLSPYAYVAMFLIDTLIDWLWYKILAGRGRTGTRAAPTEGRGGRGRAAIPTVYC